MKKIGKIVGLALLSGMAFTSYGKEIPKMADMKNPGARNEKLQLTEKWDKIFPKSDKVDHCKVVFHNRFGITLAADLYKPKNASGKLPAVAVSGPFGAVKEQSSGLYAQQLAERGFLAIADATFLLDGGYKKLTREEVLEILRQSL